MKDVIVVCHATERKYLMDEYERQLGEADIPLHIESVELPDGIGSMTMRWRLDYWQRMCGKFSDYDRIIFTDAWDVLFVGEKTELVAKIPPMLMSAERNCWPDESLASRNRMNGPWKYPNPGMLAGYPEHISAWIGALPNYTMIDAMDQLWCNVRCCDTPGLLPLDTRTILFYVVSADKEDGSLVKVDRDPCNYRYQTYPHFFHFAGTCHPSKFRALMEQEIDCL